jgi:hypothetical protein
MGNKIVLQALFIGMGSLLLSGCGVNAPKKDTFPMEVNPQEQKEGNKPADKSGIVTSLKDLLALGKDQKCTWSTNNDGQEMSGVMYISGKKFRQEIKIGATAEKKETNVINLSDGNYMYMWSTEMGKNGLKINIDEAEKDADTGKTPANEKIDFGAKYNYECTPATVTEADLTPPKDVIYQDLGEMMKGLKDLQGKFGDGIDASKFIPTEGAGE